MKADDLGLAPVALAAARQLQKEFPDVVFTSGRRGVDDQARAMASNVIHNRRWIEQTYLNAAPLQAWVDKHPEAKTQDEIAHGLAGVMLPWTDAQKRKVSRHFSGDAFDVKPVSGPKGAAIKAAIAKLPGVQKFLDTEGGLVRWHAQF